LMQDLAILRKPRIVRVTGAYMNSKKAVCIRCRGIHRGSTCGRPQAVVRLLEEAAALDAVLDPIEEAMYNGELKGRDAVRAFRAAWESVYGPQKWKVAL